MSDARAELIAQQFHEVYEALAPDFGYRTREASAKPWADVPAQNKALMIATVKRLLTGGAIAAPQVEQHPPDAIPLHERLRMLARSDCRLGDDERATLREAAAQVEQPTPPRKIVSRTHTEAQHKAALEIAFRGDEDGDSNAWIGELWQAMYDAAGQVEQPTDSPQYSTMDYGMWCPPPNPVEQADEPIERLRVQATAEDWKRAQEYVDRYYNETDPNPLRSLFAAALQEGVAREREQRSNRFEKMAGKAMSRLVRDPANKELCDEWERLVFDLRILPSNGDTP